MREQPVQSGADQHDDVGLTDCEGAGGGGRLRVIVGQEAFGHRHWQIGYAGCLDERSNVFVCLSIGRPFAQDDEGTLGACQQVERAFDRFRRRDLRWRRIDDLHQGFFCRLCIQWRAEGIRGQIKVYAARPARYGGVDRPRNPDTNILWAVDTIRGLGIRLRGIQLIELFVVTLLEINDCPIARSADQYHREAIRGGVRQGQHSVEEPRGRDGETNARLLRQISGYRCGVSCGLFVTKSNVSQTLGLCQSG